MSLSRVLLRPLEITRCNAPLRRSRETCFGRDVGEREIIDRHFRLNFRNARPCVRVRLSHTASIPELMLEVL